MGVHMRKENAVKKGNSYITYDYAVRHKTANSVTAEQMNALPELLELGMILICLSLAMGFNGSIQHNTIKKFSQNIEPAENQLTPALLCHLKAAEEARLQYWWAWLLIKTND